MKKNASFLMPWLLAAALVLTGCASHTPAPVVGHDGQPVAVPGGAAPKDIYTVKSGDTLYSIAREHGMDHRELIAMNGIENPNHIAVGRVLKIKPQGVASSNETVVAKPIAVAPVVEQRPLAGGAAPTPGASGANTEMLKREPLAGKQPYSEQALAQAQNRDAPKGAEAAPALVPAKPAEAPPPVAEEHNWVWPASGKIIANYGTNGAKGLGIAGKTGDAVAAAADGKVILANNTLRGYGNMIIVKHSATLISVYAHNSKMLVKEGQNVSKGQKIAEMGNSDADQVKLHFEVRLQGKPVDPLKYLPAR